jgi:lantibiotic modifying enzyme
VLECGSLIGKEKAEQLARKYAHLLVDQQKEEGDWISFKDKEGKRSYAYSLAHGNTGIIWFLQHFLLQYEDVVVEKAVIRAISRLEASLARIKRDLMEKGPRQIISGKSNYIDGYIGSLMVLIKGHEIFNDPSKKQKVEELLGALSVNSVHDNFYLESGLSAIGAVYLDAAKAFKEIIWIERADRVAQTFLRTATYVSEGCYWQGNNAMNVVANLTTGNSGIVSFLIKYCGFDQSIKNNSHPH